MLAAGFVGASMLLDSDRLAAKPPRMTMIVGANACGESTTFLDINHQVELLDLLTDLNCERGTTIVVVMHDLNLACRYADHVIAMKDGAIVVGGPPADVISAEVVTEVFGLDCEVIPDPLTGAPMVLPRGRHHMEPA